MLSLSACGRYSPQPWQIMRHAQLPWGRMGKKHDEAKVYTLVIQCSSELLSEYEVDAKIFQQFYLYVTHVDSPSGQGVELCRDAESSESSGKWYLVRCHLWFSMSPESISDSLIHWVWTCVSFCFVLRLLPMMRCGPCQTCDCDMCSQACGIHFT